MSTASPTSTRPLRADARRNREAILAAARAVFDVDGIYAPIDGIAAAAGVGNATLYRNFPTRDDLLAAVVDESIGELLAGSETIEHTMGADDALREWLFRVAWALRIWHDLPNCIASAIDDDGNPVQDVPTRLTRRTRQFLTRARKDGSASRTVTAEQIFELVIAISWGLDRFGDDPKRARARVALATIGVFRAR